MVTELKPVPDPNASTNFWIDLVAHPERNASGHASFEHALEAGNRFRSQENGFSRTDAWWLAEAAFLAYRRDSDQVRRIYRDNAGLNCEVLSEGGTLCHLAFNEDLAIVAFRGTESDDWRDLFDDGCFALKSWTTGRVHAGFKKAFERIHEKLEDALKTHAPGLPVWMTGHSLGAALAVLAAEMINATRGVYTFGLPRVGDGAFAKGFNERFKGRSFRYVNDHDVVTHVPPGGPWSPYAHVDEQRWIDQEGNIGTEGPEVLHFVQAVFGRPMVLYEMLQLLIEGQQWTMPDALQDHAPVLYAIHTWNDLVKNS
jgi:triacylglycerol lipase